jgi:hypothetical protein
MNPTASLAWIADLVISEMKTCEELAAGSNIARRCAKESQPGSMSCSRPAASTLEGR